jgi:NAD(P)-dependent dehydrogenase (short-subunit alcohol dehydrogenase family)
VRGTGRFAGEKDELMDGNCRRLEGRVALVTGGAAGIGRAIVGELCREGARVMLADIDRRRGEATAAAIRERGGEVRFVECDVSSEESVRNAVEQAIGVFDELGILVNNAGIPGTSQPAHLTSAEDFDRVMAVNLRGIFLCAKYALPHLVRSGHGAMVNIASTFGLVGAPATPAYAASKGGVIALTRQLAVDYGPQGVRVNVVCPGYVDNDMADRRSRMTPADAAANLAARERAASLQPLGRQAATEEIARAVAFLVSDDASFMTGSVVPVDGGCTASFNRGET